MNKNQIQNVNGVSAKCRTRVLIVTGDAKSAVRAVVVRKDGSDERPFSLKFKLGRTANSIISPEQLQCIDDLLFETAQEAAVAGVEMADEYNSYHNKTNTI